MALIIKKIKCKKSKKELRQVKKNVTLKSNLKKSRNDFFSGYHPHS